MRLATALLVLTMTTLAQADGYQQVVITEFGGADKLQVVEQPALPAPGPGEVRVRVLTASVSFTDVMVRKGVYPGVKQKPPFPPGYDLVGVIDKLGDGVDSLEVGQRVADLTLWGAYSEYAVLPADNVVALPPGLDEEQTVALILSYTTAYQMLHRVAKVTPGQSILIHGASGAVGTALAQLGRVAGLTMYGTASTAKQDYVRQLGVIPIDYKTENFVERVGKATENQGVDVVFDAVSVANFERSYESLNANGQLVTYGFYLASRDSDRMMDTVLEFLRWRWLKLWWDWFPDEERLVGFYTITDMRDEHPDWFKQDVQALFKLLAEGNIKPQIWKTLPLTEAAQA